MSDVPSGCLIAFNGNGFVWCEGGSLSEDVDSGADNYYYDYGYDNIHGHFVAFCRFRFWSCWWCCQFSFLWEAPALTLHNKVSLSVPRRVELHE